MSHLSWSIRLPSPLRRSAASCDLSPLSPSSPCVPWRGNGHSSHGPCGPLGSRACYSQGDYKNCALKFKHMHSLNTGNATCHDCTDVHAGLPEVLSQCLLQSAQYLWPQYWEQNSRSMPSFGRWARYPLPPSGRWHWKHTPGCGVEKKKDSMASQTTRRTR